MDLELLQSVGFTASSVVVRIDHLEGYPDKIYLDCYAGLASNRFVINRNGGSSEHVKMYPSGQIELTFPLDIYAQDSYQSIKEGRYHVTVQPSYDDKYGGRHYGAVSEGYFTYGPPNFEGAFLMDPKGTGKALTEGDVVDFTLLASVGEQGDFQPDDVEMRYDGHNYREPEYDEKDGIWSFERNLRYSKDDRVNISLRSVWYYKDKYGYDAERDTSWLELPLIDMGKVPEYSDFSEWLETHEDGVTVDIFVPTPTPAPTPTPTAVPATATPVPTNTPVVTPKPPRIRMPRMHAVKRAAAALESNSSKMNYQLAVDLPADMETQDGGKLEFDGISVRVTSDKKGENVILAGYGGGRKFVFDELPEHDDLEIGKTCYVWLSPFNYGDDDQKVILNAGYAGPFEVIPHVARAEETDAGTSGQATPSPTPKPTPEPSRATPAPATPKPTADVSGLSVGKTAVAGSGASKALYKVTGKNTVTYKKAKVKKSAKTVTVPATVKINGKKYKVTKIEKSAFKGYKKLKKVVVKPKGLKKKKITGCLKGTSVKAVYVPKKKYKMYKKIFIKKVTKSKVKVAVKKSK